MASFKNISFPSQSWFSQALKLSELDQEISAYEKNSNHILKKRANNSKTSHTSLYFCQQKRKKNCNFCLYYKLETTEKGEKFAFLHAEKTQLNHSHLKSLKQSEMDFIEMRRCFKGIEKEIWKILAQEKFASPKSILNLLFDKMSINERMFALYEKYPRKFKKSLDNQINKIRRKMRNPNFSFSSITMQSAESSSSFLSEETNVIINFLQNDEKQDDRMNSFSKESDCLFEDEEEWPKTITPIIFY